MPNYNLLESRDPDKLQALKDVWEPRKEYIEKDLWVIRNFLTQEELSWLNQEIDDPQGWYPTMRSPYGGNIRNKFLGSIPKYGEDGILIPPHPNNPSIFVKTPLLHDIQDRLESVLPMYFAGAGALQSFFEVPDDQIISELGRNVDYAMDFHYERDNLDSEEFQRTILNNPDKKIVSKGKITASFSVYINDDFDGGLLEFKNKEYSIKPEVGMLINIPLYKEFEHRISKVTNGNRHSLYGRSWDNLDDSHLSTRDDC
jgi:hypothetical protein